MANEPKHAVADGGMCQERHPPTRARSLWQSVLPSLVSALIAFLVVVTVSLVVIATKPGLSPLDEFQHLDSTAKAAEGRIFLPLNERVGETAMRLAACRGFNADFALQVDCGSADLRPEQFPEYGVNTAAGRASVYYIITGFSARLINWAVPQWDFLDAARYSSALVLGLGAALLAACATWVSGSPWTGSALGVTVGLFPMAVTQGTSVNPDSWSLLAGSLVVALALMRHRWRPIVYALLLTCTLVAFGLVKPNFMVLSVVPLTISFIMASGELRQRFRYVVPEAVALTVTLVAFVLVMLTSGAGGAESEAPMASALLISPNNPWQVTKVLDQTLGALLPQISDTGFINAELSNPPVSGMALVAAVFLIAGAVAGLLRERFGTRYFALSVAAIVILIGVPVFTFAGQLAVHNSFTYPTRYGLIALPVVGLALAAMRPRSAWLVFIAGGMVCAYAIAFMGVDLSIT